MIENEASFDFLKWFRRTYKNIFYYSITFKQNQPKHISASGAHKKSNTKIFENTIVLCLAAFRTHTYTIFLEQNFLHTKFNFPSFFSSQLRAQFLYCRCFCSINSLHTVRCYCTVTHLKLYFFSSLFNKTSTFFL